MNIVVNKEGQISLKNLPDGVSELTIHLEDPWIQALYSNISVGTVEGFEPNPKVLRASISVVGPKQYLLQGSLKTPLPAPCSRCGDAFLAQRDLNFELYLEPSKGEQEDLINGDPDTFYYKNDLLRLGDVFEEQMLVLAPIAECPAKKPDGSCVLCTRNPEKELETPEKANFSKESPFSVLELLKKKL